MTHEPEAPLEEQVAQWFRDHVGEDRVVTQHTFTADNTPELEESTLRRVDIMVDFSVFTLVLEVESGFENLSHQPVLYGSHGKWFVGAAVVEAGHVKQPEADMLRRAGYLILEFDTEEGGWLRETDSIDTGRDWSR